MGDGAQVGAGAASDNPHGRTALQQSKPHGQGDLGRRACEARSARSFVRARIGGGWQADSSLHHPAARRLSMPLPVPLDPRDGKRDIGSIGRSASGL